MQITSHSFKRSLVKYSFLFICCFALAYLAVFFQAGPFGTFLFIRNDLLPDIQRLIFTLSFPTAFLFSAIFLDRHIVLPKFDVLNRILAANSLVFCILGLSFASLRVPLLSREVFFCEYFFSTFLIGIYIYGLHRLFPKTLGIAPMVDPKPFETFPTILTTEINPLLIDNSLINVDAVVINLRDAPSVQTSQLLFTLTQKRVPIYDASTLIEAFWGRVELSNLRAEELESFSPRAGSSFVKRLFEISLIAVSLPIVFPVIIAIVIFIKIDSPGPILFTQTRIGLGGEKFTMLKFRSMFVSDSLYTSNRFAKKNDSRITRVGRLLRRLRLDELPQFWNIIRGDMSLIGPRPEQIQFAEHFGQIIPFYKFRHSVPPGITGWAQVMHGYADSDLETRAKLGLDLFYIKHMSLWLDILIMIKTVRTIIFGLGAR